MARLSPYLHLDGTTREALEFYKEVLGGELQVTTVGDAPWAADMPTPTGVKPDKDKVMYAALTVGDWVLMASDMMDPGSFTKGDTFSLCLVCESQAEIERVFERLSKGGNVTQPLGQMPFGWFGAFTDRYGIDWMLQYNGR